MKNVIRLIGAISLVAGATLASSTTAGACPPDTCSEDISACIDRAYNVCENRGGAQPVFAYNEPFCYYSTPDGCYMGVACDFWCE